MIRLARHTTELQRLAAGRRTWPARVWLAGTGAGTLLLLAALAFGALHNGHSGTAGALVLLAALAGVMMGLARRACVARLGWLGLFKHCLILARRFAAGHDRASMLALSRAADSIFCIAIRQSTLTQAGALIIIGNRLLAHVCISTRITAQRPN